MGSLLSYLTVHHAGNQIIIEKISNAWDYAMLGDTVDIIYNPGFCRPVIQDHRFEEITQPGMIALAGGGMIYLSFNYIFF